MARVRAPILSGSWYPAGRGQLAAAVAGYLDAPEPAGAPPPGAGRPLLAVAPHAGYTYSGPAAGRVYRRLRGFAYDRVFVLAPSHRANLREVSVSPWDAWQTPLGTVAVDREVSDRLAASPGFASHELAHAREHAEEIQLPFLQAIFGDGLRLVTLLVPPLAAAARRQAAAALAPWCDGRSLFLVSSDFTHYGAEYGYVPFTDRVPDRLAELDRGAIERVLARDPDGLVAYGERTGITMCGLDVAAFALSAPLPLGDGELVAYARSAERGGDWSLSVSYAGIVLRERAGAAAGPVADADAGARTSPPAAAGPGLAPDERTFLLALARAVVTETAHGRRPPRADAFAAARGLAPGPRLREPRGAFVTLTRAGELRGCIGYVEPIRPLLEAVADNAASAAARDPRFLPVGPDELADLHVEISALTPLRPVAGPGEIELGRHGIVLAKGRARALFLPQVAPEQGWDLPTTLRHLSRKAGLEPDAWREGARFEVFEAEVFAEPLPGLPH